MQLIFVSCTAELDKNKYQTREYWVTINALQLICDSTQDLRGLSWENDYIIF